MLKYLCFCDMYEKEILLKALNASKLYLHAIVRWCFGINIEIYMCVKIMYTHISIDKNMNTTAREQINSYKLTK
jgi:hypothetical protein